MAILNQRRSATLDQRPSARQGQALVEYSLLIAIVIAAIVGMQIYAKRSIQAGIKRMADQIGDQDRGIAYEAGERRNRTTASGKVLQRQSRVTSAADRNLVTEQVPGGGVIRTVNKDSMTTTGTLQGLVDENGEPIANVASYSEVTAEGP